MVSDKNLWEALTILEIGELTDKELVARAIRVSGQIARLQEIRGYLVDEIATRKFSVRQADAGNRVFDWIIDRVAKSAWLTAALIWWFFRRGRS